MRLADVMAGDIVLVNRKGRVFHAVVGATQAGGLTIEPIERRVTYRSCTAQEVVGHWSRRGRPRSADPGTLEPSPRQLGFDLFDADRRSSS